MLLHTDQLLQGKSGAEITNNLLTPQYKSGEINPNQPRVEQNMGCCGAAWELHSWQRKPAATCIAKGCKE